MPKGKKKGKKQSYPVGHPLHEPSAGPSSRPPEQIGEVVRPSSASASTSGQIRKKEKVVEAQKRPENIYASTSSGTASARYIPEKEENAQDPSITSSAIVKSVTPRERTEVTKERSKNIPDVESLASEFDDKVDIGTDVSNRMVITDGLPVKQKPGTLGRPIRLVCNLFPLKLLPDNDVYHYDVKIVECRRDRSSELSMLTPAKGVQRYRCLTTKVNRKVIAKMLEKDKNFYKTYAVYDGESNMYTPSPLALKFPYTKEVSIDDEYKKEAKKGAASEEESPRSNRDVFKIQIKPVEKKNAHGQKSKNCAISLSVLHELFRNRKLNIEDIQAAVMALETIFRHSPALRYIPIGRNFFHKDINNICPLSGGIEIWFGYHQSLRLGQWKIMTNLNTSATTFFSKQPLIEFMAKSLGVSTEELSRRPTIGNHELQKLRSEVKNLKIETYHIPNVVKVTHCIIDVSHKNARDITFEDVAKDGTKRILSIDQYFLERYNKKLDFPFLPCVQVKPKNKNRYLPIEVCYIPEGQHCRKELSDNDKREMIKFTADNPENRFRKIVNIRNKWANYDGDEYLKNFGIGVERDPVRLSGRTMQAPNLNYGNRKIQPRDGSWNIRDLQFYRPSNIKSWILLNLAERHCRFNDLKNFSDQLQRIGGAAGLNLGQPSDIKSIDGFRYDNLLRTLTDARKKQIQLVVVVIPFKDKTIYRNVKQIAEVELGLQTQCIDHNNARKCNPSLLGNLCLKINAKTGGINHVLTQGEIPKIMAQPVMIIGADVSHAGVTDKSGISVAAVAGSLDMILSRFAVTCKLQKNVNAKKKSVETIINLKDMVKSLLITFHDKTLGKWPEKIIFYRDGVSDGHFSEVLEKELTAIRDACKEISKSYQPAITFVVVQKRHHVRFRPEDHRDGARPEGNVPPGTVVDTEIVHPVHRDFYLCSHLGLKGTSRPAHYTVLADDSDFSAEDFQKLTYYSCNISFRCSKSISIPVPVAYADLAAYRTRLRLATLSDDAKQKQMDSPNILREALSAVELSKPVEHSMYFV
ncbi:protein argonaute-4 [Parasteatoda tepidariorum]|uniref:protein argonaute-4 n=1 Tax=Parasteatoda tepidariorum TaxID=114398 RepID=UPI0039BD28D7